MKQLTDTIMKKSGNIKDNFLFMVIFYTGIMLALILIFLISVSTKVAFIYNEF
jgi:hypothetical protein